MKTIVLALLIISFGINTNAQETKNVIKLSEPVFVTDTYEVYGENPGKIANAISLTDLIESSPKEDENAVTVKTSIAEVCEKKGCFFVATEGDYTARITFKDYGFFIPTDSEGKVVTIVGDFSKKILTEEKAKHYAEDAGKESSEISGEQVEYSIVASSIILNKETKK